MDTLTVDFVKKDKTAFKATDGEWYNGDKKLGVIFADLGKGDIVELTDFNAPWVKAYRKAGASNGSQQASGAAPKQYSAPSGDNRDVSIARAVALKAAVDAGIIDNEDNGSFAASYATFKEVVDEFFSYLTTGGFEKESK